MTSGKILILQKLLEREGIISGFQLHSSNNPCYFDRLNLVQVGNHFIVREEHESSFADNNRPPYGIVNVSDSREDAENWMYQNLRSRADNFCKRSPGYFLDDQIRT